MATPYCIICHGVYVQTEEIGTTPCGHVYHNQCLSEWFNTSETCPQCRKDCNKDQTKRVYIDFACDGDLACAQNPIAPRNANSEAEETIKMLLDHIENGEKATETQRKTDVNTCDFCKDFQDAYNDALNEKDTLTETLKNLEDENRSLEEKYQRAMKMIEKFKTRSRSQDRCDSSDTIDMSKSFDELIEMFNQT